jgi:uracil-DNA glycosylase family 4
MMPAFTRAIVEEDKLCTLKRPLSTKTSKNEHLLRLKTKVAGIDKFANFANCSACSLSKLRRRMVFGRGQLPADILFIGEAPGKMEDIKGEAFVGKSGKLLDAIIKDALKSSTGFHALQNPTYYITNTVACRPTDRLGGENREPTYEEVLHCAARLSKTVELCQPKLVIFVGKLAQRFYHKHFPNAHTMLHPSYLLRGGGRAHPEYQVTVHRLAEVFETV